MIEIKAVNHKGNVWYKPVIDGKELNHLAETRDIALLVGLGYKYDGPNSQFVGFACRMLRIESEWAK